MKTITIQIPDDCDIQIVRKEEKKEPVIKTYQDLIDNSIKIKGYWISDIGYISQLPLTFASDHNKNVAISSKVAKSMLAMAQISQLMPYYGGEITKEEWNINNIKYVIGKSKNKIIVDRNINLYTFLAFHTEEQREEFLKYNEQLVKDYLMID